MDACLHVIIDTEKLPEGIHTKAPDGSAFGTVDDDGRYVWGEHVDIQKIDMPSYFLAKLPLEYSNLNLQTYALSGKCLDLLADESKGKTVDWGGNSLIELIHKMVNKSKYWAVVFEPNCDTIHFVKELKEDDMLSLLKSNLESDYMGFVLYGKSSDK